MAQPSYNGLGDTGLARRSKMQAKVGDMLVVHGQRTGVPDHLGRITEVRGKEGGPPFMVRWDDDGHEGLVFPGPDAVVSHQAPDS